MSPAKKVAPKVTLITMKESTNNPYVKARFEETGLGGPRLAPKLQPLMSSLTGNESWEKYQDIIARIKETQ